jgi:hypothetical protein
MLKTRHASSLERSSPSRPSLKGNRKIVAVCAASDSADPLLLRVARGEGEARNFLELVLYNSDILDTLSLLFIFIAPYVFVMV